MKMDMTDVRAALWDAYQLEKERHGYIEGKMSEGYCELLYPIIYDCKTKEEFLKPNGIMIYSYALGTSRRHYIRYDEQEKEVDYNSWTSPDIFKKAIDVINEWMKE